MASRLTLFSSLVHASTSFRHLFELDWMQISKFSFDLVGYTAVALNYTVAGKISPEDVRELLPRARLPPLDDSHKILTSFLGGRCQTY